MISDGKARRIAAEWHAPGTGMSALSHTGMIDDRVMHEIERELAHLEPALNAYARESLRDLQALQQYVQVSGHRTPVEGWHKYWDSGFVIPNGTRCDLCGDESNSEPGLTCGRVEGEFVFGDVPCVGTYRPNFR